MRSRPDVKVYLTPPVVLPGSELLVDVELEEKTETPVDWISATLDCTLFTAVGQGKYRQEEKVQLHAQAYRLEPKSLSPGTHRHRLAFQIPPHLPASYGVSGDASVSYTLTVHVSIPWWPDRLSRFTVPVAFPPGPAPNVNPQVFVSSSQGPRGTEPFVEVSLATIEVAPGDVLAGTVSLANLGGKRVRGLYVSLVEREAILVPAAASGETRRFKVRVFDGSPPENEPIPFRLRVPEAASPTFNTKTFSVATHLEVRADVAWGGDIVLTPPILVWPRTNVPHAVAEWIAPVGRERRMAIWRSVADRFQLVADDEHERLVGSRGDVTIALRTEHRDEDFWLVATLAFPDLGLDLSVAPRAWSDTLALDIVRSGDAVLDARLAAHAREHVQAAPVVPALTAALAPFERATLSDVGAELAVRGAAHAADRVEAFTADVLRAAEAIDEARRRIPPPAMFVADVPAWEVLAATLRGRFDRGRMAIRGGSIGTDRVEIVSTWARNGILFGVTLRVAVDPALASVPASPHDPALSPAARACWRELASKVSDLVVGADHIEARIEGKPADPAALLPLVELAVSLRRQLAGVTGAGPFR